MTERILLSLGIWIAASLALGLLRRHSPLHPAAIAVVATALVGTFYPLATLWIRPLTWRSVGHLPEEVLLGVQAEYLVFAVGLLAAVLLARSLGWLRRPPQPENRPAPWTVHRDRVVSLGLILGGALLYAGFVSRVGVGVLLDYQDFATKYLAGQGLGFLSIGLNLVICGVLWAEAGSVGHLLRWTARILAVAVALWALFFISTRTYFAVLLLGYLYVLCRNRGLELGRVRLRVVVLLLAAYLGVEGYMLVRGSYRGDFLEAVATVREMGVTDDQTLGWLVGGSELSHPFVTAAEVQRYEEAGELACGSYLDAFQILMPLALFPDRPRSLSQRFVEDYYPAVAERGGGAAFSLVAEAWWNLGRGIGSLLVGCLAGLGLLWFEARRNLGPGHPLTRLSPYLVSVVLLAHRSTFALIVKQMVCLLGPILLLILLATLTWTATRHAPPLRALRQAP